MAIIYVSLPLRVELEKTLPGCPTSLPNRLPGGAHRSYSTRILKFGREVWEKTIGTLTKYASTVQTQAHRRTFMLIWLTEFGASLNLLCCCLVRCHFSITITLYHARWRDFVKIHLPYNQFLSKNLEDYSNYSTSRHKNCYQHYLVPDNIYPISSAPKTR